MTAAIDRVMDCVGVGSGIIGGGGGGACSGGSEWWWWWCIVCVVVRVTLVCHTL